MTGLTLMYDFPGRLLTEGRKGSGCSVKKQVTAAQETRPQLVFQHQCLLSWKESEYKSTTRATCGCSATSVSAVSLNRKQLAELQQLTVACERCVRLM